MRGVIVAVFVAASVLTGTACLAEGRLASWEGRYPLGMRGEYGSFFAVPEVQAAIAKSVPGDWMKKLRRLHVNTPFKRSGNVLYAFLCKAHDCGANNAVIYFDLERQTLQMCVNRFDEKTQTGSATWVGKAARPLSPGSCEESIDAYRRFGER